VSCGSRRASVSPRHGSAMRLTSAVRERICNLGAVRHVSRKRTGVPRNGQDGLGPFLAWTFMHSVHASHDNPGALRMSACTHTYRPSTRARSFRPGCEKMLVQRACSLAICTMRRVNGRKRPEFPRGRGAPPVEMLAVAFSRATQAAAFREAGEPQTDSAPSRGMYWHRAVVVRE
jgi:hypothetical protein